MKQIYSNVHFFKNQFRILLKSKAIFFANRILSSILIFFFGLLSMQVKAQTYCTPNISNSGVYITALQFNFGTPSQSYIANGNSGYTATLGSSSGNLNQYHNSSSFYHSISNTSGSAKQVNLKGYADWNNDGDFDDLLEIFLNYNVSVPANSSSTTGGNIFPELAAIPGNIRIRFVLKVGTDTATACGTAEEVEDYYMVVQANVAPVLNTSLTNTLSSIKSTDTNNEGFYINELVDMNEPTAHLITDADDRGTTFQTAVPRGIAIYNQTATNGVWQYKVGSGSWTNFGSVSTSNALHLLADASSTAYQNKTKIRFVPTGVGTPTFNFRAWDGTNGLNYNGTFHAISSTGGATSYSSNTTSASLPVLLGSDFDGTKMYLVNDNIDQQLNFADINRTTGIVTEPNSLLSGSDSYKGYDIAIDETNGKIYWSNTDYINVSYCNLDGTGVSTIANVDANGLTGVAVGGNKLYYSGYSGIQVSNLDGSSKAAVSFDISGLCDIGDIEYDNGKLYFVYSYCSDFKYNVIQCNTDGTGLTVLYSTANYIKGLNVVNGTAYWTENKSTTNEGYVYKKAVSLGSGGSATLVINEQKTGYNDVFVDPSNSFIYVLDYDPVFGSGHTGLKRTSLTGTNTTRLGYYKMNVYSLVSNNSVLSTSPALSANSLTGFGNVCSNNTSAPNSFTISGTDLTTANITVAALAGYTYSTTAGGTYTSTLSLVQPGGSYSQPIYVKFTPTAVQTFYGNIAIGGGGATSVNVATTGSGIDCTPTVTTSTVLNITPEGATLSGEINADGGATVTERGFVYGTSANPTTANTKIIKGNGTGTFTESVTGLSSSTSYNFRAYAINSTGTSYGANQAFTTQAAVAGTAVVTNVACNGGTNGAINLTPTGGTAPYTFNWGGGILTEDRTGLVAGTYSVVITDTNGYTGTVSGITVTQPTAISLTAASQTNISCNGGSNGAASVNTPTGGTPGYTYNWTPGNPTGDGTASVTGLTAGTWTCTVTDANACTASQSFTITQPPAIVATAAAQTNVSCFGGSNGAASINTPTGGAGGYTYTWSPSGGTAATASGLAAGSYTVTVTDANGCTATRNFTITQPSAISTATGSQTNVSCNGGTNGSASVSPSGGTAGYTYTWSPSGGTAATA
ncbi:beta strand repeat-containing protein, partial [Flavobacterium soyangense]